MRRRPRRRLLAVQAGQVRAAAVRPVDAGDGLRRRPRFIVVCQVTAGQPEEARYAILHIHASGGVSSLGAESPEAVRAKASAHLAYFARSCVVATLPFRCRPASDGAGWDATPPDEVKRALGEDLMRLYAQDG